TRGELDSVVAVRIRQDAKFTVARIHEIEDETKHDLLAFVQAVRENLRPKDRPEFHRGMTSYDTEEIPTSLRLTESLRVVREELEGLRRVIAVQAVAHKKTLKMGRTHGQAAEPTTLGLVMLGWYDFFGRDLDRLTAANDVAAVGKIAGAVGTYGELGPEIEKAVCESLRLRPALHSTQILHRDRIAQVMAALAVLAGNIEHVAICFRLMGQSDFCEVREPFGKGQKGSSRMPHKKNTITTEQLTGMARVVRGNNMAALEEIATWEERDISQSCVERIILPDTFHLIHYMIKKLTWVLEKMEVLPTNMERNMARSRGCIYSGVVKDLLLGWGWEAEGVYNLMQSLSFRAIDTETQLLSLLFDQPEIQQVIVDLVRQVELESCFDPWRGLQHLDEVFARILPHDDSSTQE
ncbi:MAG: adenylosuccinate lyase, partial [Patescibacteria group bacterium]